MKNTRFPLLFLLFAFIVLPGYSQLIPNKSRFDLSLLGGGVISNYFGKDISDNKPMAGYYYGGRATWYFSTFLGVEAGYGFNQLGTIENSGSLEIKNKTSYHQVPVLVRLKGKHISLGAGFELNILQDAKQWHNENKLEENVKHLYKSTYKAGCADLTVKLGKISSAGISVSYGLEPLLKEEFDWTAGVIRVFYLIRLY